MASNRSIPCDVCTQLMKIRVDVGSSFGFFNAVSLLVLFMLFYIHALICKLVYSDKKPEPEKITVREKSTVVLICTAKQAPEAPYLTVLA